MDARNEILGRLRGKARDARLPAAWRSRRSFDRAEARFAAALEAVHGEVIAADGLEDALDRLDAVLEGLGARRVAVNDEPPLDEVNFPARFPGIVWENPVKFSKIRQGSEKWRAFCASADAGVSTARAALAETGSLVLASGPGMSRLTTLLPPVHIALVPLSRMTTDVFTWTAARQGEMPASVTLVSGPSKTADIEQTMAVGVHGPKRLIVILYED